MYKLLFHPIHRVYISLGRPNGSDPTHSALLNAYTTRNRAPIALPARCLHTKNFYDVLNVAQECTAKEIRESFIRLSMQYHPDHSKDAGSSAKFQKIMEAYRVLSKADTRQIYDENLVSRAVYARSGFVNVKHDSYENIRRQAHSSIPKNYYGISGMKKKSNALIVWTILGFAAVGVLIQALAIKSSFTFKRDQLDQASIRASKIHTELREEARKHDRSDQLERVIGNLKRTS